jgi:aryl-alcohol dehydrogenase-like predicted oxidoreductase
MIAGSTLGGSQRRRVVGDEEAMTMQARRLGRIGHMTSVLVYGGAALFDVTEEVADRSIGLALEAGINHFDTAADYGDSELHLGRWMDRIRDQIFLATKTGDRTASGAYDSIRRSLERLRVGQVDLIQLHAVSDLEDLGRVLGPAGAIEGAVKAREEGLVEAIGITGHGMGAPATHLEALRRFPFESVITPWNYRLAQDVQYRRDFEALLEEIRDQDVGLRVIKSVARNLWKKSEEAPYTTWYEPMYEQEHITASVAFVLGRTEVAGVCTAGDVRLLPLFIQAEREMSSVSAEQVEDVLSGVTDYEPPFVRVEGREIPDWLEPLVP